MIDSKEIAARLVSAALAASQTLDESTRDVLVLESDSQKKAYKRAVGHVLIEIRERILDPIFARHPELVPESWQDWYTPPSHTSD